MHLLVIVRLRGENIKLELYGQFLSPSLDGFENVLQSLQLDEETIRRASERGIILVNQNYNQQEVDPELFVTVIHETIHSNRNLMLFDVTRDNKNENAYSFNNDRFEQNTSEYNYSYVDASQEVIKGNIDTSRKTISSYKGTSSEELEDMDWKDGEKFSQREKQQIVDEALVEIMARLSYNLYTNKKEGKSTDVWEEIEDLRREHEGEDIDAMCKIILKHHDLELFKWMIDPVTYQEGDIHYDFFGEYTQYDQDLLDELYGSDDVLDLKELFGEVESNEISKNDIKEVATSQTALEELGLSVKAIIKRGKEHETEKTI